jgi:hypothetical protein
MMVSFTPQQHLWLRATAFERRSTPTVVLRRCLDEVVDQLDDAAGEVHPRLLASVTAADRSRVGTAETGWHRMTVLLAPRQYEWLRAQAFAIDVSIARVVRGCLSIARPALGDGPTLSGGSPGAVAPRRGARRPPQVAAVRADLRVSLPADLHSWLRRQAFDQRTTAAELVRRYVSAAHQQLDSTQPGSVLSLP